MQIHLCLDKILELIESEIELCKLLNQNYIAEKGRGKTRIRKECRLKWAASHNDLFELSCALHRCGTITDENGNLPPFIDIITFFGNMFGVEVGDVYVKKSRMLDRKRRVTPFLDKLILAYNRIVDEHLK